MARARRLRLRHPAGETRLLIGAGALGAAAAELGPWLAGRRVFLITSRKVERLHGALLAPLARHAGRWRTLRVADGEAAKSPESAARLWRALLRGGGRRDCRLIALGGGSTGDLAGFVAGCFLRGVEYAQLPTTLLAQVDAAIGGKTAINLPEAKNSVGLFHHPRHVISDTAVLTTLPAAEVRSGLLEVVKMAALLDPALLRRIERGLDALLAAEPAALAPVVAAAAAAKIRLVERDPEDRAERRLLNFGHTLGHALETVLGYRRLRHGEAVAYGMLFALRLAQRRGLGEVAAARLAALIGRFALPPLPPLDAAALLAVIERDKKAGRAGLRWIVPEAIGRGRVVEDVTRRELRRELIGFLDDPLAPPG